MYDIQKARLGAINCTPSVWLRNGGIGPESQQKLTTVNPLAVEAGLEDVLVVAETTASQSPMKFFRSPMSLRVRTVSPVTGANWGESGTLPMNQTGDIIPGKSWEKIMRTRRKMNVSWKLWRGRGLNDRLHRERWRCIRLAINENTTSLLVTWLWAGAGQKGRPFRGVHQRRAPRLNIMQQWKRRSLPKWLVGQMTVRRSVNRQDRAREVDMHASLVTPQKAAPKLTKMGAETVEWNPKAGDVQYVADEKALTI
jgi:hypothetical protein